MLLRRNLSLTCACILLAGWSLAAAGAPQAKNKTEPGSQPAASTKPGGKAGSLSPGSIDINSASEKDLTKLPGVGTATAKKIVAGRPYKSVDDVKRAGVSQNTIEQMRPYVTTGGGSAERAAGGRSEPSPPPANAPSSAGSRATSPSTADRGQTAPQPGMVWVNTDSGVYHREGDRWYGKTKQGKYMTEADAIKAGYRAAKTGEKQK